MSTLVLQDMYRGGVTKQGKREYISPSVMGESKMSKTEKSKSMVFGDMDRNIFKK
jgi:hypothetical protein